MPTKNEKEKKEKFASWLNLGFLAHFGFFIMALGIFLALLGLGFNLAISNITHAFEQKCIVSLDGELNLKDGFEFPQDSVCIRYLNHSGIGLGYNNATAVYNYNDCAEYNHTYVKVPPVMGKGKMTVEMPCVIAWKIYENNN